MLTQERADILTGYLTNDSVRAKELFNLEPEEALIAINSSGYDFTIEEIQSYCEIFKQYAEQQEQRELSMEELSEVSGGVVITTAVVLKVGGSLLACFGIGAGIGIAAGAKW